jgi:hypothetical protein
MTKYSVEGKAAENKAAKEGAYRIPRKMKGRQGLQDGEAVVSGRIFIPGIAIIH